MSVLRFVLYFNNHTDLKYTGCLDFSPYMVVIDGQYSYAIYISISIYIHVNFNCMSEIHIFLLLLFVDRVAQLVERRSSNSKVAGSRPSRGRQHLSACAGYGNYIIHSRTFS